MRFLGIGETCDLGSMYHRLARAGHEVRVYVQDPRAHDVYDGLVSRTADWRAELDWLRAAGSDGVALFESASQGDWQDELRQSGYLVVGGSAYGDRLESDRAFGQKVLEGMGMQTAATHTFESFAEAKQFLERQPSRYVFKNNGANALRTRNYVGQLQDGSDMLSYLKVQEHNESGRPSFVLMEHVQGIEVGVGAYFDGHQFLKPVLLDWEHKHFFSGDMGELTGEMGTIVTYRGGETLFERTLAPMAEPLRNAGHCGYINLNLMINERGIWPLEFTSRFGYPGFAICEALHLEDWSAVFRKMLRQSDASLLQTRDGFACGVVLTVPPFPHAFGYEELSKGAPICDRSGHDLQELMDIPALHFAEVARVGDRLIASGSIGYIGVATGAGLTVTEARDEAYRAAEQVIVPNLRYRRDIGERLIRTDLDLLTRWGYMPLT